MTPAFQCSCWRNIRLFYYFFAITGRKEYVFGTRRSRWRNRREKKGEKIEFLAAQNGSLTVRLCSDNCAGAAFSRGSLTCQKLHIRPDPLPVDAAAPARKRGLFFCSLLSVSLSNRRQFKHKLFLKTYAFSVNLTNLIYIFLQTRKYQLDLILWTVNQSRMIDQFQKFVK